MRGSAGQRYWHMGRSRASCARVAQGTGEERFRSTAFFSARSWRTAGYEETKFVIFSGVANTGDFKDGFAEPVFARVGEGAGKRHFRRENGPPRRKESREGLQLLALRGVSVDAVVARICGIENAGSLAITGVSNA